MQCTGGIRLRLSYAAQVYAGFTGHDLYVSDRTYYVIR